MKITRQGKRIYDNSIQDVFSPRGERHFWIGGGVVYWEHGDDTDINAVEEDYVSVTPVHLDFTNYSVLDMMKNDLPSFEGITAAESHEGH